MQRYPPPSPSLDVPADYAASRPSSPRLRSSISSTRPPPPASSVYNMPEDHKRTLSIGTGARRAGGLPLYAGGGAGAGGRGGGAAAGLLGARLRHGKARWIVLAALICGAWLWRSSGTGAVRSAVSTPVGVVEQAGKGDGLIVEKPTWHLAEDVTHPSSPEIVAGRKADLPSRPPPLPAHRPSTAPVDNSPIDVSVRPRPSSHSPPDPSERFLAYSPHSGYHNQRISLENALTLAFLLQRTLLLPPVWFGHAIPYISFDKLQRRLQMASKEGLEHCIPHGEGSAADPIPRECDGFWDWTTADWSFLVDLSEAEKLVPLRRRDNLSVEWLEETLDLRRADKRGRGGDTYYLKDDTMYQYRFYDSLDDAEPLDKWGNRVDLDRFKADTDDFKLVHVGTLFGTSRLRTTLEANFDARSTFRRAMVFRTEIVDEISHEIRDQLGGPGQYYGLHLRVGDGVFQKEARENMRGVWEKLCVEKMKLDKAVCDEVRERSQRGQPLVPRDRLEDIGDAVDPFGDSSAAPLAKRANSRPQREGAYKHAPLPALTVIRTLSDSPLSSQLSCRGSLHTAEHLLPFNAPLFIATDSPLPSQHPHLKLFFDAFPCTFVLGDFSGLPALGRMNRMRNEEDKTPLAGFLYPQLDAQIAAWGRGLVGTPQSTYSRFAVDVLHQVYHGWEIVERG